MVWPGVNGVPVLEPPVPKKRWYQLRWWSSIPGAVIVTGVIVGIVLTGKPKSNDPLGLGPYHHQGARMGAARRKENHGAITKQRMGSKRR
jgi:hypothetical protein